MKEISVEFTWHSGFALVQKRKNISALHENARGQGVASVLEVSTKSEEELGCRLSAFNLKVDVPGVGGVPLECAFQGSKRFERGGPYPDLFTKAPKDAKRDPRLKDSGRLVSFEFVGKSWPLEPKTAFYDWLYVTALYPHRHYLHRHLLKYDGFTDIEFNPSRSLNCQARSCALLASLLANNHLDRAAESPHAFLEIVARNMPTQIGGSPSQGQLL